MCFFCACVAGARNMAQAYVSSPHRTREQLNNVKSGFKECTQNMCTIEHTLEQMMGTLHFQMKGKIFTFIRLFIYYLNK